MVLSARDAQGKVSQVEAFPGRGFSSQGIPESDDIVELRLLAGSQGAVPETGEEARQTLFSQVPSRGHIQLMAMSRDLVSVDLGALRWPSTREPSTRAPRPERHRLQSF